MIKPVILTVDDEPQVLNAIERDLRSYYRDRYRILKAASGKEALDITLKLKQRDDPLAIFLVDQRMPDMSGTEFLVEAAKIYPEAKKVLLTAYADTEAAIASINQVGLDYYLMKPWDPPEQHLYPILDDLLSDWLSTVPLPYDGIRVAGTLWSSTSHGIKDFLARNRVPYQWLDIEKDAHIQEMVEAANQGDHRLPVIFFPDGSFLIQPDFRRLAEKVGMQIHAAQPFYDLIIVGAGPAGLGAAVYGASEGLRTALIEREATGGQAGTSSRIENYLGFPNGVSGIDLARRATIQARRLGAEILTAADATGVRVDGSYRFIQLSDGLELGCRALLIATGVTIRQLEAPNLAELTGAGVYYGAALTEAANYAGEHVLIIGGANSAGQAAIFFSRFASKVSLVIRADSMEPGMSHYLVSQINDTPNIEILANTEVVEAVGDGRLQAVRLVNRQTEELCTIETPAMFIFIGAVPHTDFMAGVVERNRAGFILTGPDLLGDNAGAKSWPLDRDPYLLEASVPGIFAAGDVRQGAVRRVASAVGEGAIAVSMVHQYLKTV